MRLGPVPRPFNLIRRAVLVCYDVAERCANSRGRTTGSGASDLAAHQPCASGSAEGVDELLRRISQDTSTAMGTGSAAMRKGSAAMRRGSAAMRRGSIMRKGVGSVWQDDESRRRLNEKSAEDKASDFVERALSAQVRQRQHSISTPALCFTPTASSTVLLLVCCAQSLRAPPSRRNSLNIACSRAAHARSDYSQRRSLHSTSLVRSTLKVRSIECTFRTP